MLNSSCRSSRRLLSLLPCALALLIASGCDEEATTPPETVRWDTIGDEPSAAVALTSATRGVGYFFGDTFGTSGAELAQRFEVAVFRSQLLDELLFSREGDTSVPQSLFAARIETLRAELQAEQSFGRAAIVLDLMRWADGSKAAGPTPYLAPWDENDGRPTDTYGFWRDEYRDAVLDEIAKAAEAQQPEYFIVGAEMERYLSMPGGEDDYVNFVALYREAYDRIKSVSPNTRVGAGVDWVRLQLDVAPTMTVATADLPADLQDESMERLVCATLPSVDAATRVRYERACTDAAFARYVEPLLSRPNPDHDPENALSQEVLPVADILALSAVPGGTDFGNSAQACPEDFFGYLRTWSQTWPVVYYQVNWQVTSESNEEKPTQWLETLLERNAGVNIELLAWALVRDMSSNDCGKLKNDLGASDSVCYQGMWSVSNRKKKVYEAFGE